MEQKKEKELKEAIRDALSEICWKDENGMFYEEIYADYRDTLDDRTLKAICSADRPREKFYDLLDEWYCDSEWDYAEEIVKKVLDDETVTELAEPLDADDVRELIREQFYVSYPEKHFLKEDVLVDLILDTGDMNYDFVSNSIGGHYNACDHSIPEESSLLWLARQQGYRKSELKKTLAGCGNTQSSLLKSIYVETQNCSSHMNALVFLVKMTLEEYFNLRDAIGKEKKRNESYYLAQRTGPAIWYLHAIPPAVFMTAGTVPAVCWKSSWKKTSACRSDALPLLTMMDAMAMESVKSTDAARNCGVTMPSKKSIR